MKKIIFIIVLFTYSIWGQNNHNWFFQGDLASFSFFNGFDNNVNRPGNFSLGGGYEGELTWTNIDNLTWNASLNSSWFELSGKQNNEKAKQFEFLVFYPELGIKYKLNKYFSLATNIGYTIFGRQNQLGGNTQWVPGSDKEFNPWLIDIIGYYSYNPLINFSIGFKTFLNANIYETVTKEVKPIFSSIKIPFLNFGIHINLSKLFSNSSNKNHKNINNSYDITKTEQKNDNSKKFENAKKNKKTININANKQKQKKDGTQLGQKSPKLNKLCFTKDPSKKDVCFDFSYSHSIEIFYSQNKINPKPFRLLIELVKENVNNFKTIYLLVSNTDFEKSFYTLDDEYIKKYYKIKIDPKIPINEIKLEYH